MTPSLAMSAPERLSTSIRAAVEAGPNVLSVVTYCEVVLKSSTAKLVEVGDRRVWWETALSDFAATTMPLRSKHVAELCDLAPIHQDPSTGRWSPKPWRKIWRWSPQTAQCRIRLERLRVIC